MLLVSNQKIEKYLIEDKTEGRLNAYSKEGDENLVCQKWLRQSSAKRYIYEALYGDLFELSTSLKVFDVGGGLTSMTKYLATHHDYTLADLLAHDNLELAECMMNDVGKQFIFADDWVNIEPSKYDLVIANDIFPNVDQRLEIFLNRFLPLTRRLRLSLTYYDNPRFYMTRRMDGDEVLCMLAWDSRQLCSVLERFSSYISSFDVSVFQHENESVYPNGRQVCLIEFHGGIVVS